MKARAALWVALGVTILLFMLSKTEKGKEVVADTADAIASGIKGFRLNNPLNIERGDPWVGLSADQPNARFANFISMPYGIRAAAVTLRNYQRLYNIRSVAAIVNRWNPVSDGQPATYIPFVAAEIGVQANQNLELHERSTMAALIRAMMMMEIGRAASLLVSDADLQQGLTLAGYA